MKQRIVLFFALALTLFQGFALDLGSLVYPTNPQSVDFSAYVGKKSTKSISVKFTDAVSPEPDPNPNNSVVMSNGNGSQQLNGAYLITSDITLSIRGTNSNMFYATVTGQTLYPDVSYTVTITYVPIESGSHHATLKVQRDCSSTISVELNGEASIDTLGTRESENDFYGKWNGVNLSDDITLPNGFKPIKPQDSTNGSDIPIPDIPDWYVEGIPEIYIDEDGLVFPITRVGETVTRSFEIWGVNTSKHRKIKMYLTDPNGVFFLDRDYIDGLDIDMNNQGHKVKVSVTFRPTSSGTYKARIKFWGFGWSIYPVVGNMWVDFGATAVVAPTPTINTSTSSLEFCYPVVGETVTKTFKVTGNNLTGSLTLKLSDENNVFSITPKTISVADANKGATVTVTFKSTVASNYIGKITISGGGASSKTVSLSGNNRNFSVNPSSLDFGNTLVGESKTERIRINGLNLNGSLTLQLHDPTGYFAINPNVIPIESTNNMNEIQDFVTVTYYPTSPGTHNATLIVSGGGAPSQTVSLKGTCVNKPTIIVSPTSLSFGTVVKGKTSSKTFTVQGLNLTGSLSVKSNNAKFTVTPATISKDNAANTVAVTVTYKPTGAGSDSGTITVSGGGATNQTVSVSGKCVVPTITVSPIALDFGNIVKGNSSTKTFLVTGTDLTGSLTVKSSNTNFTVSPTTISKANATNGVYVNVTYNPSARGNHSGTITVSGGDAESKTVSVSGKCIQPSITVNPTSLSLGSVVKGNTSSNTFTVTGTDLTGSLTVTSNNSKFTVSPATITAAKASSGVTVTVTYKPTARGNDSGTITVSGGDATSKTVSVSGTCVNPPTITVNPTSLLFGNVVKGNSPTKTFTVNGTDLTGSLTVSSNSSYFTVSPTTITAAEAKAGKTVTVTFKATATGEKSGTITVSGGGASSKTVSVSGTCVVPDPYITTSKMDVNFDSQNTSKKFKVYGHYLTSSLTLSVGPGGYSVSPMTISASAANSENGVEVTVKCLPNKAGENKVKISGGGAATVYVNLHYSSGGINQIGAIEPDDEGNGYDSNYVFLSALGNSTSDVGELIQDVKIYAEGQNIVIESPMEQSAVISDVAGRAWTVNLQVGRNEIPVNASGLFIVRVREKTAKLMLR